MEKNVIQKDLSKCLECALWFVNIWTERETRVKVFEVLNLFNCSMFFRKIKYVIFHVSHLIKISVGKYVK